MVARVFEAAPSNARDNMLLNEAPRCPALPPTMSSDVPRSLNCTAFFTRLPTSRGTCVVEKPLEDLGFFSGEIGRIKFVGGHCGMTFNIKFGNTQK